MKRQRQKREKNWKEDKENRERWRQEGSEEGTQGQKLRFMTGKAELIGLSTAYVF